VVPPQHFFDEGETEVILEDVLASQLSNLHSIWADGGYWRWRAESTKKGIQDLSQEVAEIKEVFKNRAVHSRGL